ncbi:MAG: TIM barrel protein [Planctomycetaceae bacterium]|jgi:hydroxypyruvate isomerase|nr:TIM barrel protein [Planctomycetaceae bacterium]MBT6157733.1 TIM barrel protein [Planctomycetaceae bacterium]MBT6484862.1 TIM barrel protein [Planctomycetaceae bacterium]MBT6497666.1 TIM barrel protein [Planctomycetaceae bacterium]
MNRRDFLTTGLAGGVALTAGLSPQRADAKTPGRFRLNYAPHFGMFRNLAGDDPIDQIRFMADQGFRSLQDNGLRDRPKQWRQQVRAEMDRRGMSMGTFIATAEFGSPTFTSGRKHLRSQILFDMQKSLEVARQMDARWMIVVPGKIDDRLSAEQQMAHAVELLKRCAELCEHDSRVMVLEPLNGRGMFLRSTSQARRICRAVDSPACKLMFDVADQPASSGRLIPNIEECWDEIAYFQVGDNPGRKEPGTGQIDFRSVFRHITARRFDGLLGMEHGNSRPGEEGEQRVIDAYVAHEMA